MNGIEKPENGRVAAFGGGLSSLSSHAAAESAESRRSGTYARDGRKYIDIEKLLQWTYRDELPKAERGGYGAMSSPSARVSDWVGGDSPSWRDEPGFLAVGDPDPDALAVDAMVQALGTIGVDWAASRERLCPEFAALLDEHDVMLASMSIAAPVLVVANARMGTWPSVEPAEFTIEREVGRNGKPIVHGIDRSGRYPPGAHCLLLYSPDPREVARDRMHYAVWHQLLCDLADALRESLARHVPLRPGCTPAPWCDPDPQPVVLPNLKRSKDFASTTPHTIRKAA